MKCLNTYNNINPTAHRQQQYFYLFYRGSRASGDPVFEAARSAPLAKQNLASAIHNIQ
jgi:hypothetical protein